MSICHGDLCPSHIWSGYYHEKSGCWWHRLLLLINVWHQPHHPLEHPRQNKPNPAFTRHPTTAAAATLLPHYNCYSHPPKRQPPSPPQCCKANIAFVDVDVDVLVYYQLVPTLLEMVCVRCRVVLTLGHPDTCEAGRCAKILLGIKKWYL